MGSHQREEAKKKGWKVIATSWIDINKGDDIEEIYRSELIAEQCNTEQNDGWFASTSPLEALQYLVHATPTIDDIEGEDNVSMIDDVARAFFETVATRYVCVKLPEECEERDGETNVGNLRMSLYGICDAAMNWHQQVAKQIKTYGVQERKVQSSSVRP